MGPEALVRLYAAFDNRRVARRIMLDLPDKIAALLATSKLLGTSYGDLDQIENTLTDGYACALSLEAEQWRIEKRIAEVAQEIQHGDTATKVIELGTLATRRERGARELGKLRLLLAELRRYADDVRLAAI
jgi:hypothetical protein